MAYLESGASLEDVLGAYERTSVYDLEGDLTLCREHIQACRILIGRTADETRQGPSALRDNAKKYSDAEKAAVEWLSSRDADFAGSAGAGWVRQISLQSLRDC